MLANVIRIDAIIQKMMFSGGIIKSIGILSEIYHNRSTIPTSPSINPIINAVKPRIVDSAIKMENTPPLESPKLRIIPISRSIRIVVTRIQTNWAIAARMNDCINSA